MNNIHTVVSWLALEFFPQKNIGKLVACKRLNKISSFPYCIFTFSNPTITDNRNVSWRKRKRFSLFFCGSEGRSLLPFKALAFSEPFPMAPKMV